MGNESSRDTEHTERGCEQLLPNLALDQEMIRSSLRKRGLLVAERDLNDALDRHSNPVEAISFLIESGRARRAVDVQRRSTIRIVKNDRRCTPTESALSTTKERSLGKRARRDSEVSDPGEATLKRRIHNQDPETLVLSENANDSGLREISTKACAPMLAIGCDSTSVIGSKEMKAESVEMEKHVVTPMKPGLDTFQGNKTESPRRTFSPKAAADEPTVRPLAKSPKLLQLGNLQHAMLSGIKGWSSKTPEEKKEAVRVVKDNLCLVDVGAQRKDQLDDQLTRCICVALTDLADAPDINAGITLIGDIIQATRSSIHGVIIETGVLYSELFSVGKSSGRASNAGVHRVASKWRYTSSMKSPSPADNCISRPFNTSGTWRTFNQVDHLERGGLFSSNRLSSFLEQPRAIQSSQGCGRTTGLPFEARKGTASRVGSGAAGLPKAPEEEVYWIASGVCKETLRKAKVARNEVEWVANQAGAVKKAVDRTKAALRKDLQRQEEKVEKVEGDVRRLSEELEQLTRGLIEEHVASNQTKEEALLSFLDTLKGGDGEGDRKVKDRATSIALHEAARSSCRKASAERLLVSHAVKIGEVLCHELFGDLLDILSDMEMRASQRRLKCQSDLKSTAKHMLDKLEAAVGSLMYRRRIAAKKREERIHNAMESQMLFGNATANGAADQALINEMECFMEEASTRADAIKADANEMWSRMQEDLSKEDVLGIAEDAKQFFSGEADVNKGEVAESSPGESVCEASQQKIIAKAKIDI